MTFPVADICIACKHYQPGEMRGACPAFPNGIPRRVRSGPDWHLDVSGEEEGEAISFELAPGWSMAEVESMMGKAKRYSEYMQSITLGDM